MATVLRYRGVGVLQGTCERCGALTLLTAEAIAEGGSPRSCPRCSVVGMRWHWVAPCPVCSILSPVDPAEWSTAARVHVACPDHGVRTVATRRAESWRGIAVAILLALLIRGFLVEAFKIPSASMVPTLLIGDQIFVNKTAFGVHVPFTEWWPIPVHDLERGDVAVFLFPIDPTKNFIKRVIGLPGDEIRVVGHDLYINGTQIPHTSATGPDPEHFVYFQETIGTHTHLVQYNPQMPHPDKTFQVPEGGFFVMGDNRDHSYDSRGWGIVPFGHLKGKAMMIWLPRDCEAGEQWMGDAVKCRGVRWERFGQWVE